MRCATTRKREGADINVRQWLGRARYIDREIQSLEKALQDARDQATRITQNYEADGAQSSKDPHKLDRLAEYADLIREKQTELITVKKEITEAIYQLEDGRQRTVLLEFFVNAKKLEKVAVDVNYSYPQTKRVLRHGVAGLEKKHELE